MEREKKFHIYELNTHCPLEYEGAALEFDTLEAAKHFLDSTFITNAVINEDILYYDGGYCDATGWIYDPEEDELVEDVR